MRKRGLLSTFISTLCIALIITGCGPKNSPSSREAIGTSQAMKTTEDKVNYLIGQATMFLNAKKYDDAIMTAQHVLNSVDANSAKARELLQTAKSRLTAEAKTALAEAKIRLSSSKK